MKKLQKTPSLTELSFFTADEPSNIAIPLSAESITAGFPSPAEDFSELSIDLNKELIHHPANTFFCRVNGDSMQDIGIGDGDLLVIDKSLEVRNGKIAVCFIDGEFTLKKIQIESDVCWLIPANKAFKPIKVDKHNDFSIWGIVTYCIKAY